MIDNPDELKVLHNPEQGRFEIQVGGHTAELTYRLKDGIITFIHAGVPPEMEGKGIGSKLARAGLTYARENGLKVRTFCSFVEGTIQKHPEYQDLLA